MTSPLTTHSLGGDFFAQAYVSATTFMVLSNLNKFVVVGFGMLVLREASSWQAVAGVTMALLGGVWYAQARASSAVAKG